MNTLKHWYGNQRWWAGYVVVYIRAKIEYSIVDNRLAMKKTNRCRLREGNSGTTFLNSLSHDFIKFTVYIIILCVFWVTCIFA